MSATSFFDFPLKPSQQEAFEQMKSFAAVKGRAAFVLKGYAGTGKTTLMRGLILFLQQKNINFKLLASTGRAAKMLGEKTGQAAVTVHSMVYGYKGFNHDLEEVANWKEEDIEKGGKQLRLQFEPRKRPHNPEAPEHWVYIVDEASMVADEAGKHDHMALFGEGKLLTDLLNYDTQGRYLFVGDPCQLPPVSQPTSPALSATYLQEHHRLQVEEFELTEVVRHQDESGILAASYTLRKQVVNPPVQRWAHLFLHAFQDVHFYPGFPQLLDAYLEKLKARGPGYTTLICHTNAQRLQLNRVIRESLGRRSTELEPGDLLMVNQNNPLTGLVNGDFALVKELGTKELYRGLVFQKAVISPLHQPDVQMDVLVIADLLDTKATNISSLEHRRLIVDFYYRMKDKGIKSGSQEFQDEMRRDPYLNALRAVYGYAVTCHKCQGGEWAEAFLWQDNKIQGMPRPAIYQWWYTALTRAVNTFHLADDWFVK
jgi:ATP-dependent exoDNAse (exonuclease V) alpha subunit